MNGNFRPHDSITNSHLSPKPKPGNEALTAGNSSSSLRVREHLRVGIQPRKRRRETGSRGLLRLHTRDDSYRDTCTRTWGSVFGITVVRRRLHVKHHRWYPRRHRPPEGEIPAADQGHAHAENSPGRLHAVLSRQEGQHSEPPPPRLPHGRPRPNGPGQEQDHHRCRACLIPGPVPP